MNKSHHPPTTRYEPMLTSDGSSTLIHPVFKEAYSSAHGAWMQANELYLQLSQTHLHPNPQVLEVGFGLGMNFRATLQNALERGVQLEYLSYELFPVSKEILASIEVPILSRAAKIWSKLLETWPSSPTSDGLSLNGDWGKLQIHFSDVLTSNFPLNYANAIYFDPFSPEVNPEPWRVEICRKLYQAAKVNARLATYSVAGTVRRNLMAAGFEVERVKGVGKKQWLVAKKEDRGQQ